MDVRCGQRELTYTAKGIFFVAIVKRYVTRQHVSRDKCFICSLL